MTLQEAIRDRHTVRTYTGAALEGATLETLEGMIREFNEEAGLHMQLVNGKQDAFEGFTIHYGKWTGVTNYIAFIGKDSGKLDELCGYYGEHIVLWAQQNGLRTGWLDTQYDALPAGLELKDGERLVLCLAIGYSDITGNAHKVKDIADLSTVEGEAPEWFVNGMEMAQLAPTAGNQQLFNIKWDGEKLSISSEPGFLEKVDLGIAKYHFEIGSGINHSKWSD